MIIHLKDCKEETLNLCLERNSNNSYYSKKLLIQCINAHINDNLRYNTITGETLNKTEWISKYVNKKDIPVITKVNEKIEGAWKFAGHVRNSASRKIRGYSLI